MEFVNLASFLFMVSLFTGALYGVLITHPVCLTSILNASTEHPIKMIIDSFNGAMFYFGAIFVGNLALLIFPNILIYFLNRRNLDTMPLQKILLFISIIFDLIIISIFSMASGHIIYQHAYA